MTKFEVSFVGNVYPPRLVEADCYEFMSGGVLVFSIKGAIGNRFCPTPLERG